MKKIIVLAGMLCTITGFGQKVTGKLKLTQGQLLNINMELESTISQEAMGQTIDFNIDGVANHAYKVTNTTDDNSTLHHDVKRIQFNFEGMGQKMPFDSDNPKDLEGPFGKPVKEMLKKSFDIIVDPTGKVLMVQPEKQQAIEMDDRMKLIASMLKDVLSVVEPPAKNSNSFLKVLPDKEVEKGESWTESYETAEGKFNNTYTLTEITDSTLIINYTGTSTTSSKLEIMPGMEISKNLTNKTSGKITLDKATGILRQKTINTESTGTAQGMGGETPITSKLSIVITVSPQN